MTRRSHWLLACLLALGCGAPAVPDPRPLVLVSVLPQRYFVEQLAGDLVRVEVMIPPGANPSTFEPSVRQLVALDEAALYVLVGHPHFPFERAWLDTLLRQRPGLPTLDAGVAVDGGDEDPHIWVSPRYARTMARAIEAGLAELLPGARATLASRRVALEAEIDALDAELRRVLDAVRGRRFVVLHPAWGHLAADYGIEQIAIERHGKPPDPLWLAEVIREARARGDRVVFAQPHFDPAGARVVADEIGAQVELLDPLAYDWAANLRRVARALARSMAS